MREIDKIAEGLEILRKIEGCHTYAEHDVFMVSVPQDVSEDDRKRLEELGWSKSKGGEGWEIYT
jgi:hypothetical protein